MQGNILFVDDDQKLLSGLQRILHNKKDEWQLLFANTVDQAHQFLAEKSIDVAVLDINMPRKNGFDLLGYIKQDLEDDRIEVIMLTGLKNKDLKRKALNLGATDLINKPISKQDLIARINSVLRTKKYSDDLVDKNKLLEDQLIQSQKMQIVGTLAAGVIHDLKNILSIIRGYPDIIKLRIEKDKPIDRQVDNIKKAVNRASRLTVQILELTRPHADCQKKCDLVEIVNESYNIVKPIFDKTIQFEINLPEIDAEIEANPTQISQVLLNLFINAEKAVSEKDGKIQVDLTKVHYDENSQYQAGDYYKLSMSDNGKGMDQKTIDNIFTPQYTTRASKGGYGLGLFIIRTIVERHDGLIDVESEPGQGTTFNILFNLNNRAD
ncbi:MAG TPA: response regulator [bacterium]|nr:response regulator [bacterium]